MEGGFTAASFVSPLHHLRTPVFLSNRWGPPHSAFREFQAQLQRYLNSSLTNGTCTPEWARATILKQNFSMQEYIRLVANAVRAFPLNPEMLDLAFHAALLTSDYEIIESFGDEILEAKGSIRIPFYSREKRFQLVIDTRNRLITTAPGGIANESGSADLASFDSFAIPFASIRSLEQRAPNDTTTGALGSKS